MSIFEKYGMGYPMTVMYIRNLSKKEFQRKIKIMDNRAFAYKGKDKIWLTGLKHDDVEFFTKYLVKKKQKVKNRKRKK